ncbi:uncharacterized protein LOC119089130 [Peromyscus leucopus]|uniref:uncharacterized protein LOC119089130 n=1 Tax=Peromyscus leucopus TaxID=10041 RepID=UPI001885A2AE|nr:uncharacterized protein LOC119089130 [Peromyscus leucopus]
MSPFAILYSGKTGTLNIIPNGSIYDISCKDCYLTNCLNSITNPKTFVILHQPSHVLLPVNLSSPWYEDPALFALEYIADSLSRPKRLVAAIFLGIAALIAIITTVAASATALTQQIHTAHHVNSLSKNVSMALITQEGIDQGLIDRINVLEEAILYMGNQIQNIKTRLTASCHADYKWICVTPLPFNGSDRSWDQVQAHLRGVWNSSQLGINIGTLHYQISAISHSRLQVSSAAEVASYFANSVKDFVYNNSFWNLIINIGIIGPLIILLLFLLPVIFRRLGSAVRVAQREIHTLHLLNEKMG